MKYNTPPPENYLLNGTNIIKQVNLMQTRIFNFTFIMELLAICPCHNTKGTITVVWEKFSIKNFSDAQLRPKN